jgi:O-antigen ligase
LFSFKYFKKLFNQFTLIFLIFILFDFFILGIYFGGLDLFDRFLFLNEELNINSFLSTETNVVDIKNSYVPINRFEIISISINFFKKFIFFGYGAGSFEKTFILFYEDLTLFYANHAHSDFIELMGEFGIVGLLIISLIFISLAKTTLNSFLDDDNYFKIMTLTLTLIFFINGFVDFSLNIPSNQYLFASLFSISLKKKSKVY